MKAPIFCEYFDPEPAFVSPGNYILQIMCK